MIDANQGSAAHAIEPALTKPARPIIFVALILVIAILIFGKYLGWGALNFNIALADVASRLAPLAVAAAMIERVVEILISPWRDAGANKLEKAVAAIQARTTDSATAATKTSDLESASDELDGYRGITQRYAFAISLTISTLVSIAGVRALEPFVDSNKFSELLKLHPEQHTFFLSVDAFVSAALLAGGADGIHSIVNAVTSFFDATADKATKASNT